MPLSARPTPVSKHVDRQSTHVAAFLGEVPNGTHKATDLNAAYGASASAEDLPPLGRTSFYRAADLVLGLRWRKGNADVYRVARYPESPIHTAVTPAHSTGQSDAPDVFDGFLPGVYSPATGSRVEAPVLFADFQAYAAENRLIELRRWSRQTFYRALEERGYVRKRSTGGRFVVLGLRKHVSPS